MSDLGRLFRLSATGLKPLENFTTAALAIAIARDPRPIKKALQAIDLTCQGSERHPALVAVKEGLPSGTSIGADTQTTLWPVDGIGIGCLDLVLKVGDEQAPENVIWVEVKVDASESGNQIDVYGAHAARCCPRPAIVTLARTQIRPQVPFLRWSDVVDAIDSISDPHYTWLSLREFLLEERIVRPPVPTQPSNVEACMDVVIAVNRRVRELWPQGGLAWAVEGALRSALLRSREAKQDLSAEAGPILHGFAFIEGAWQWRLAFSVARNYERVPLDPRRVLSDAEIGGLPEEWRRNPYQPEVLERRLQPGGLSSHDDIVRWFDDGLRQLSDAGVLSSYLAGYTAKQAKAEERAQAAAKPPSEGYVP